MKKLRNVLVVMMALGAVTFTSCKKSGSTSEADTAQMVADSIAAAQEMADSMAQLESQVTEVADSDAAAGTTPALSQGSEFDAWLLNGSGSKSITLENLGDEESGMTANGLAQLEYIATVLEANEGLKAVIKGHTDSDQKVGNGRGRAVWAKAKLILGHDAVGSRISTEGVGTKEPLAGVDLADDSQKRVTVSFTK